MVKLSKEKIFEISKNVLNIEIDTIKDLYNTLDLAFFETIKKIYESKGRIIITGIGKSAIVANKIVATLNSTGSPAIFMHAADAIHGDLGIIQKDDVIIIISKSGDTPEIKVLIPLIKGNNIIVGITANNTSYLAINSNHTLLTPINQEACPNNLAPTSSTTAQMVIGDILAVCLLSIKGFKKEDFAKYHPGGALGKKLYLKVSDIINPKLKPLVALEDSIDEVISQISSNRLGATAVVENSKIKGIITDGDIRRLFSKKEDIRTFKASDIYNKNPKTINESELAINALNIARKSNISQVIVCNSNNEYKGMVHLHELLKEGLL